MLKLGAKLPLERKWLIARVFIHYETSGKYWAYKFCNNKIKQKKKQGLCALFFCVKFVDFRAVRRRHLVGKCLPF